MKTPTLTRVLTPADTYAERSKAGHKTEIPVPHGGVGGGGYDGDMKKKSIHNEKVSSLDKIGG
jgi:hypothetical protein